VFRCEEEEQVFNEEIQNCDWAWHNPCCNETLVVPTTPPAEFCQSADCAEDGYFAEGDCEPDFCQCIGGAGHLLHCQDGLFFNDATHVCDWPWNNPGCFATTWHPNSTDGTTTGSINGTTAVTGTTSGNYNDTTFSTGTTTGYYNETTISVGTTSGNGNETTVGTTPTPVSQCSVDCSGMNNGFYAEGCCENTYCECFHGEGVLNSCPEGAVFNEEGGFCDDAENVACCGSTDVPTTTFPPVTTEAPSGDCEFDCTGEEDGAYPEGCCLPTYCVCTEGVGAVHDCNNGTVFDEIAGFCHHPNNVECCQHTTSLYKIN